jgi:transcriptional regulator with XRE-family HTH domain
MNTDASKPSALGRTPDSSLRRVRDILVRAARAPGSVGDDDLAAAAAWILDQASGQYKPRPLDLKALIARRGLTQQNLAEILGVGHAAVSAWVTGRKRPSKEMASRLAEVLKVPRLRLIQALGGQKRHDQSPSGHRRYDPKLPLTGRNFAAARREVGLTQKALAKIVGTCQQEVSNFEIGKGIASALRRKMQDEIRRRLGK